MPVSQDRAIEIARTFLRQRRVADEDPLHYDSPSVRYERGGYGTTHMGMGATYWTLVFLRVQQNGVITCPGEVIVFVDEQTGSVATFRGP